MSIMAATTASHRSLQPALSRRERIQEFLRPVCERIGLPLFSRPGLHGLDREIARRLPGRNGWFVEAGANDGFRQSNTYYLARFRGWRGVLIEPVPHLAEECRRKRPESQVFQCALGAPANSNTELQLRYAGLMSCICGAFNGDMDERQRSEDGQSVQGIPIQETLFNVPMRTLTELLDESRTPRNFDLLSLDVEGYEVEALKGLDLQRYRPKAMCIEVRHEHMDPIRDFLTPYYQRMEPLHRSEHYTDLWITCPTS